MSGWLAVYRAALHAYPREFRRGYQAALVQTVVDRCQFGGERIGPVVLRELADLVPTAIRMKGSPRCSDSAWRSESLS